MGILNGGDSKRRAPTRGNTDHYIVFARLSLRHLSLAKRCGILVRLNCSSQSLCSSRHDELDHAGVGFERWGTLGCVKCGDTSTGSGSDINQAAANTQRVGDHVDRVGDCRQCSPDGRRNFGVFAIDDARDLQGRLAIETSRGAVGLFRSQPAQIRTMVAFQLATSKASMTAS